MTTEGLSDWIDQLHARLAFNCHRFLVESGMNKHELALRSGVSDTLLKGIEGPDFTASLRTLRRIEAVMPRGWAPAPVSVPAAPAVDARRFAFDRRQCSGPLSRCFKQYLSLDAVAAADPGQIGRARDYLRQRAEAAGSLREGMFRLDVLKAMAPQCAIHVLDVGDPRPEAFRIQHWDNSTGFKGGRDFSGTLMGDCPDRDLSRCVTEDYRTCRDTGWEHLTAIARDFVNYEARRFLRYMMPFVGHDGRARIVSINRPVEIRF